MAVDKGAILGQSNFCNSLVPDELEDQSLFGKLHGPLSLIVWGLPCQKHTSRCADLACSPQNRGSWTAPSLSTQWDSARGGAARFGGFNVDLPRPTRSAHVKGGGGGVDKGDPIERSAVGAHCSAQTFKTDRL